MKTKLSLFLILIVLLYSCNNREKVISSTIKDSLNLTLDAEIDTLDTISVFKFIGSKEILRSNNSEKDFISLSNSGILRLEGGAVGQQLKLYDKAKSTMILSEFDYNTYPLRHLEAIEYNFGENPYLLIATRAGDDKIQTKLDVVSLKNQKKIFSDSTMSSNIYVFKKYIVIPLGSQGDYHTFEYKNGKFVQSDVEFDWFEFDKFPNKYK